MSCSGGYEVGDSAELPSFGNTHNCVRKVLRPRAFLLKGEQLICTMSPQRRQRVSNEQGNAGARDYSQATSGQIDQQVRKLLDDAYQLARTTLIADRDKLGAIA